MALKLMPANADTYNANADAWRAAVSEMLSLPMDESKKAIIQLYYSGDLSSLSNSRPGHFWGEVQAQDCRDRATLFDVKVVPQLHSNGNTPQDRAVQPVTLSLEQEGTLLV
eukprot:510060-Amphidinium_carterae.1